MTKISNEAKQRIIDTVKIYKGNKRLDGEMRADMENYYMTQANPERLLYNIAAVENIVENNVPGDIVEIGVWRGGSMLSMILALQELNVSDRTIRLYDTFDGMTEPTELDRFANGTTALDFTKEHYKTDDISEMCKIPLEEVQNNIESNSTYPRELIHYHKGDILKTTVFPEQIAILRLDTDWYESTKFELENFYDLVSPGGVIIIDDYGAWVGARKATDDFIAERKLTVQLFDATGGAVLFFKPN